jgi:hypothetical protein
LHFVIKITAGEWLFAFCLVFEFGVFTIKELSFEIFWGIK